MKMRHMPCGLHYFYDSGYERTPYRPQIGEEVVMQLLVEDANQIQNCQMLWHQDGLLMEPVVGVPFEKENDDRCFYKFALPVFVSCSQIDYQFMVHADDKQEWSKHYTFDVLTQVDLGEPEQVYMDGKTIIACFATVKLTLNWDNGLQCQLLQSTGEDCLQHDEQDEYHIKQGEYEVWVNKSPFFWKLKRYSKSLMEFRASDGVLIQDKFNQVCGYAYKGEIAGSRLVGFGERFDKVEQQGEDIYLRVVEHYTNQGQYTYMPIPFFFSDEGIGWFSPSSRRIWAKEAHFPGKIALECETNKEGVLYEEWWFIGEPSAMIKRLHEKSGKAVLPPKWAFGIWMSANGWDTQQETLAQLDMLKEYKLPGTAIVLEAWSDEKTFYIFNDAQYQSKDSSKAYAYDDFSFPKNGKWPNPKQMAQTLKDENINLVLWQIPVIKKAWEGPNQQLLDDEAHAIAHRYCIMNDDGTPYRITDGWFSGSLLLDFTNPQATKWWFDKRAYLVDELHAMGFKTDGGEFLFDDTVHLYDGQRGETAHNLYPNQYVGAYHRFISDKNIQGVTFSRAGYTGAQQYPVHWAGDQLSSFSELRSQLTAGLTIGLSGIPFWTFDIGGFAGEFPSKELYLRSVALAGLSPAMQWHSEPRNGQFFLTQRERWNNDRSPWNLASLYEDQSIIDVYRLYGNFRMNLMPYLYQEAKYCAENARPMMAHLLIDQPNNKKAWDAKDIFMLGRNILVAPVVEEGATQRQLYLPKGQWYDLWHGQLLMGDETITYDCPVGEIPVFIAKGSVIPLHVNHGGIVGTIHPEGSVGNRLDAYEVLAFLQVGENQATFEDDIGTKLILKDQQVSGWGIKQVLLVDMLQPGNDITIFGHGKKATRVEVKNNDELLCDR